ncbi:hypothetical protein OEZ86_004331 [Tetradesmus obliquus]|nr:hypothetical protein OEZ86_004331 [Tetradesmus obliquus]
MKQQRPIAAASLIKLGSCRLSSGAVISFSSPNSVQLRGQQVMLLAKYVELLLAGVRGVAPYALSGQRVPTVAEIQQIRQQLEASLGGRLPEPAVQLVPLKRTAAGQAAHLLVQVPSAAVAKQLV